LFKLKLKPIKYQKVFDLENFSPSLQGIITAQLTKKKFIQKEKKKFL